MISPVRFLRGSNNARAMEMRKTVRQSYLESLKSQSIDFHRLCHQSRKSESSALILAFEWYRKGLIRKARSGRVFSGSWIWPKYGVGFGKTQDILTGNGILQLPGKRDSPQDARFFCLYIGNSRNHIFWGQTRVNPALNCWLLSN